MTHLGIKIPCWLSIDFGLMAWAMIPFHCVQGHICNGKTLFLLKVLWKTLKVWTFKPRLQRKNVIWKQEPSKPSQIFFWGLSTRSEHVAVWYCCICNLGTALITKDDVHIFTNGSQTGWATQIIFNLIQNYYFWCENEKSLSFLDADLAVKDANLIFTLGLFLQSIPGV